MQPLTSLLLLVFPAAAAAAAVAAAVPAAGATTALDALAAADVASSASAPASVVPLATAGAAKCNSAISHFQPFQDSFSSRQNRVFRLFSHLQPKSEATVKSEHLVKWKHPISHISNTKTTWGSTTRLRLPRLKRVF